MQSFFRYVDAFNRFYSYYFFKFIDELFSKNMTLPRIFLGLSLVSLCFYFLRKALFGR